MVVFPSIVCRLSADRNGESKCSRAVYPVLYVESDRFRGTGAGAVSSGQGEKSAGGLDAVGSQNDGHSFLRVRFIMCSAVLAAFGR